MPTDKHAYSKDLLNPRYVGPQSVRTQYETAVVVQSELKLLAEGANIGRGKQQFGGPLPFGASLPILRQRQHIGAVIFHGAQRAAVFGRQRSGQLGSKIRGAQQG